MSSRANKILYEVYQMQEDLKEREEMLADADRPIWQTDLGGITLEKLWAVTQAGLARQGTIISRAGFLKLQGYALFTAAGIAKLRNLGVEVSGFQVVIDPKQATTLPRR